MSARGGYDAGEREDCSAMGEPATVQQSAVHAAFTVACLEELRARRAEEVRPLLRAARRALAMSRGDANLFRAVERLAEVIDRLAAPLGPLVLAPEEATAHGDGAPGPATAGSEGVA